MIIVDSLPASRKALTFYLIPSGENSYHQHVYIDGAWKDSGTMEIDLSNFYTKDQTYTKAETDEIAANAFPSGL